jgi:pyrimidine operon attenuation protein/uracil phosphoribosyltransferase
VGKNLPTSTIERVMVRLGEIDGEEGVWIESPALTPTREDQQ